MPRTSSTSNPTKLIEIDRKRVTIDVSRDGGERFAALTRLDLDGYDISPDLKLVMIARVRSTFQRIELGTAGAWDHSPQRLIRLDATGVLRFRLLLHKADNPLLTASAENLVSRDVEQADSFFVMEPAALGEVGWEVSWSGGEPILLFNQELFPNARGAVGYTPFAALVLPEVVRQVAAKIAEDPERLSDDTDALHPWKGFLDGLGADLPPDADADDAEKAAWVTAVVNMFAARTRLGSDLRRLLNNVD
jgi:hypothetical protein